MESTTISAKEWAESLVDRDWEIYWNDDEDKDDKDTPAAAAAAAAAAFMQVDKPTENGETDKKESSGEGEASDEGSQGSIIDDWYAGRIKSATALEDGAVLVRVLFVGDEHIYEMELGPSKVRPSARGWIKRTMALISRKGDLPPDTATPEDRLHIQAMQEDERNSRRYYEPISFPDRKENTPSLDVADLYEIMELRNNLTSQIYLRSKLATVVNLHGSIKYIDGEPNPTEPLINHLVECCKDLDQACEWYFRCWELLMTCFGQRSGQSSNENESHHERSINYDKVMDDYLEFGKNVILNCSTMDVESTSSSKRRQLSSPPSQRRPKRRRRNNFKWTSDGDHQPVEAVADEGDFRCTAFVDFFVEKLNATSRAWYLPIFGKMLQILSHHIVDPLVHWKMEVNKLLGRKDDLRDVLGLPEESVKSDASPQSKAASAVARDDQAGENDDMSVDTSDLVQEQTFTYEEIEACLKAQEGNRVLSLLDVSEDQRTLELKLGVIEATANQARTWLGRLFEDAPTSSQDQAQTWLGRLFEGAPTSSQEDVTNPKDEILEGLQGILKDLSSPDHLASNVDPIGAKGSSVTREALQGAVQLRRWLLDVRHASRVRERKAFIQRLVTSMDELPDLSELPSYCDLETASIFRAEAEQQVREMHAKLVSLAEIEQTYDEELAERGQPGNSLWSKDGAKMALDKLGNMPVLLPAEEMIALRLDLMQWRDEAASTLPSGKTSIAFTQVEKLFKSLQSILKGKTRISAKASKQPRPNEKVENLLRNFAAKDAEMIDPSQIARVTTLYTTSLQWKERAEAVISALRNHGNVSVGVSEPHAKLPSMVDIKRVGDLVAEYESLGVEVPGYTSTLQKVLDDASTWFTLLEKKLDEESLTCKEYLVVLEEASESRPKGLIMDPTRQVVETIVQLLEWHQDTASALDSLSSSLRGSDAASSKQSFSDGIVNKLYPVLAEGCAIVERYSERAGGAYKCTVTSSVQFLERRFVIRRSAHAPLPERIEAHPFGKKLLNRIVEKDFDKREGFPMAVLLWVDWHLSVAAFVLAVDQREEGDIVRSLSQARDLLSTEPRTEGDSSPVWMISMLSTKEKERLQQLINGGEEAEERIRQLLSKSRDLKKGCMQNADSVRQHLSQLKEYHATFKERATGKAGLPLDPSLEPQLDYHVKVFTWLVRTFSYPFLYLDEASYVAANECKENGDGRIPWDVLVSLAERLPPEKEASIDDFALVSLRIRELHEAGTRWQEEITRTTSLSNRGGKRRGNAISPIKGEQETESVRMLEMEKMKQLAASPILSKVLMPREDAVHGILRSSTEFETRLHEFLGKDYDGDHPDRAAFPDSDSLVGKKGEFILFRLTGGDLYESVLRSMDELSVVAGDVLAETPGKATFDWIKQAVDWIQELNDKVTKESPFPDARDNVLIIPGDQARILIESGDKLFLEVPDDLKKTLSQHGIIVSTNRQEQSLRVVVKKNGAHHSLGGTVIRWCPILFEALKADHNREQKWSRDIQSTLNDFAAFMKLDKDENKKKEKEYLYRWYCYRERVAALLEYGARSLIVAPKPGVVTNFGKLLQSMSDFISKHAEPEFEQEFAKMLFAERTSLVDDRFVRLESLLYRKSLAVDQYSAVASEDPRTVRDRCRSLLARSFTKALQAIGMTKADEGFGHNQLESFCAIRAWEIENEMFDRFQDELGVTSFSEEYRGKARSLRASFDDKNNLSFCLQVLVGDVTPSNLVSMSKEQMASEKTRLERERAKKQAISQVNLTPEIQESTKKIAPEGVAKSQRADEKKACSPAKLSSILRKPKIASPTKPKEAPPDVAEADQHDELAVNKTSSISNAADTQHPLLLQQQALESIADKSAAALKKLSAPRATRPPPPPSLVNAFKNSCSDSDDEESFGQRVHDESGGDTFRFETNLRLNFDVGLYLEDTSAGDVDRFLPKTLTEKGRLPEDEFTRFVSDKLGGGRWKAVPLRLVPLSQQDYQNCAEFFKAYDAKKRIAMVSMSQNTKLFLVSPKFHGAAKLAGVASLSSKTDSYIIVLTKDVFG